MIGKASVAEDSTMIDPNEVPPLLCSSATAKKTAVNSRSMLTVNGRAELVVQDAESYQLILERLDRAETVA